MNNGLPESAHVGAVTESNGSSHGPSHGPIAAKKPPAPSHEPIAAKKPPASVISQQLREELIRILQTGDLKNDGAFTVSVAAHVEKFVVAAREILMTENLAQNDLGSLMMMRKQHVGGPWSGLSLGGGGFVGDSLSMPVPINNENFGVQAIRQVVEAVRTMGDSPAKLVEALAIARQNNLTDVVEAIEKKLGVAKDASPPVPNPDIVDPQGALQ